MRAQSWSELPTTAQSIGAAMPALPRSIPVSSRQASKAPLAAAFALFGEDLRIAGAGGLTASGEPVPPGTAVGDAKLACGRVECAHAVFESHKRPRQ